MRPRQSRGKRRTALLFLAHNIPHPHDSGATIRTFNLLRLLSTHFDVTLLCLAPPALRPRAGAPVSSAAEVLARYATVLGCHQSHTAPRLRLVRDHVSSLLTTHPYTYFSYSHATFRRNLHTALAAGGFALAHVDSIDLHRYLPLLTETPFVLGHHNVESGLLASRARIAHPFLRPYFQLQAERVRDVERTWATRAALNTVVSDLDGAALTTLAPGSSVTVVPNGVDTEYFKPSHSQHHSGIVFVGAAGWAPNRDAMAYFTEAVLPLFPVPHPRVTWVGAASGRDVNHFSRRGVVMAGRVDDIRPLVHGAACAVVPLRVGGGTRLKVLDAWAMGVPVVSTTIGCEGLQAQDGRNILIRDEPAAMALAIQSLLVNQQLRAVLARNARRTAIEQYSWNAIGSNLASHYFSAIGAPSRVS